MFIIEHNKIFNLDQPFSLTGHKYIHTLIAYITRQVQLAKWIRRLPLL
jgi:hypothetical protein